MKTVLVVFGFPDGKYVSCQGDDLATLPQAGRSYLFSQRLYQVDEVIECLSLESGDGQLMNLLKLLAQMEGKSTPPAIQDLRGRPATVLTQPDRVLLVRLQPLAIKTRLRNAGPTPHIRIQLPASGK